jgi:serine/threonine-protein kinase
MTVQKTLGHYEIFAPIGAGGMGEVYVARDPKLGRRVAIKMLPLRLTQERDTLTRFTQEARSASALNHPNIVTIHEVGASEGVPYIVMEYIEGTDLRSMIAAGPTPVRKALDVAAQIADGLAAAHERGIIHRDLKPENIMLTRDGFVKILDFGLAKIMAPSAEYGDDTLQLDLPATNPGTILGTVGYMSPEQATGKRLDFRSDQFALGAILYELVTGRAAFAGENAIDTLSAILHNDPPPVNRVVTKVPVQLADIIKRLLEKAADDRYTSTRDLARELRLLRDRVTAEESGFHRSAEYAPQQRRSMVLVAALALAAFLAGAFFLARDRITRATATTTTATAEQKPIAKKYLAVMTFRDLTGDPTGQLLVDGFAETLTARLSSYPAVQVMRPPAAETETEPRKLARNLGANLVLTGSMARSDQNIRVNYTVLDPATGREWRAIVDGSVANLFGVQDDVAEHVARDLQLGQATTRVALDPAVSQRRYLEALGLLRRYDQDDSLDEAIRILEELGPSPTVEAALARAYLLKYERTRQPSFAADASEAAENALKADPQNLDVNITLAQLRLRTGRHDEAITAFMRVLSQQPNHADATLGLAKTYSAAGDYARAEQMHQRAIALQPNYWGAYHHLGAFYFGRGQYEKAIPQFHKVTQLIPDGESGYVNLGAMYLALGRYDAALQVFQQSVQRKASPHSFTNLATTYYYLGRFQEAAAAGEKAVELRPHSFVYWRNLGDAYRWTPGQEQKARNAYTRAVALSDDAIRINRNDAQAHRTRASALAKLGNQRGARAAILRALEVEPQRGANAYDAAVIANIGGDEEEALARIEQAVRFGYSVHDIERDPEFANLRKSGRLNSIIPAARSTAR